MGAVDGEPTTAASHGWLREEDIWWDELKAQRERADQAYRAVADPIPRDFGGMQDYTDLRDIRVETFTIENDRLVALELRWQNRRRMPR